MVRRWVRCEHIKIILKTKRWNKKKGTTCINGKKHPLPILHKDITHSSRTMWCGYLAIGFVAYLCIYLYTNISLSLSIYFRTEKCGNLLTYTLSMVNGERDRKSARNPQKSFQCTNIGEVGTHQKFIHLHTVDLSTLSSLQDMKCLFYRKYTKNSLNKMHDSVPDDSIGKYKRHTLTMNFHMSCLFLT